MAPSPLVSVIVPTLDGRELLAECLPGLKAQSLPRDRFETIVVDNGSSDGTAQWLAADFPETVLVRLPENLGFAEAINRGAAAARGEYLVFLNNDAIPDSRFLEELLRMATSANPPDCVAARILDRAGEEIEFGGASLSIFGFGSAGSSLHRRFCEAKAGDHVPFACGGAMLVRAKVFERLGGFDRDYFAYYEDVDFGWRLWMSGGRVVYAPQAEVRHRSHATSDRFPPAWRHLHWYRNALLTLLKNSDDEMLPRLLPFAIVMFFQRIGHLYQSAAQASADGEADRARILLESAMGAADGIGWILGNMDSLWEKRRRIQALRRLPDRALAESLHIRVDFGDEAGPSENARALRLLRYMDLSALLSPERAETAAMSAARGIADDAMAAAERVHPTLVAAQTEAGRLGTELHERNLELERVHAELHARNLDVQSLRSQLELARVEEEELRGRLQATRLAMEELQHVTRTQQERLAAIESSRSWRWTAPLRRLPAAKKG